MLRSSTEKTQRAFGFVFELEHVFFLLGVLLFCLGGCTGNSHPLRESSIVPTPLALPPFFLPSPSPTVTSSPSPTVTSSPSPTATSSPSPTATSSPSPTVCNNQRLVIASVFANDLLLGSSVTALADGNGIYSSEVFPTNANSRGVQAAVWLKAPYPVSQVFLHARMNGAVPEGFPAVYSVFVTDPLNTKWIPIASNITTQPDTNGIVSFYVNSTTQGVNIVPTQLGVDRFSNNVFQMGEIDILYGNSSCLSNLEINQTAVVLNAQTPPPFLKYAANPVTYTQNQSIAVNQPIVTGAITSNYSVSPALPAGLTLDPNTGLISGTPTVAAANASYVISATSVLGNTNTTLQLQVAASFVQANGSSVVVIDNNSTNPNCAYFTDALGKPIFLGCNTNPGQKNTFSFAMDPGACNSFPLYFINGVQSSWPPPASSIIRTTSFQTGPSSNPGGLSGFAFFRSGNSLTAIMDDSNPPINYGDAHNFNDYHVNITFPSANITFQNSTIACGP